MTEVADVPQGAQTTAVRKKFATPPVKIACLACRASRTRCNGENPCASCKSRERTCVYKPSRRGGPRTRKKPQPVPPADNNELASPYPDPVPAAASNLSVENYINPGAGLKNLNDVLNDSDMLFDSLFMGGNSSGNIVPDVLPAAAEVGPIARTYGSDASVLNAYYIWIHPYFPILPPPEIPILPDDAGSLFQSRPMDIDESSSPVALAISAILALVPHPDDANPLSDESIRFRRNYAQFLAQSAFESTEGESDTRPDVEPSMALDDSDDEVTRQPFHGGVPVELESVIAFDLLSVYEYAQRGNLKRMRSRASSALVSAMNLSLHIHSDEDDIFAEARRRVWWMTFVCICQSSIVSNTNPTFEVFASSFTTKIPFLAGDPEAWPLFIKSQKAILTATQFVIELNKAMSTHADMTPIYQRMIDLERLLEPLVRESESWATNCSLTQVVDRYEAVVGHCLRCMAKFKLNSARIKVHRYCAFFDLPVFPRKNCDLRPIQEKDKDTTELRHWPSCCSNLLGNHSSSHSHSGSSSSPTQSMRSTPNSEGGMNYLTPPALVFPYSSHQSAKICFKSAVNIEQAFASLAYPNVSAQPCDAPCYIGPTSSIIAPRTMPSFACCAMQCAYVLLMVHDKTQSMYPGWNGDTGALANDLLGRLQQGLMSILATLENYGTAFEALGGMRDQIRAKVFMSINFNQGA